MIDERPADLYEDMMKLNSLYEELCWDHNDILEFVPDYKNNRIIVNNILNKFIKRQINKFKNK